MAKKKASMNGKGAKRAKARAVPARAMSAKRSTKRPAAAVPATASSGSAARPAASAMRLPRDPKGRRAQFYQDPAIDQLWAVVAALTGEVSVAFDRLDTFERVLERHGYVTRAAIEAYRPDEVAAAERSRRREELIQRVFEVLSQYAT